MSAVFRHSETISDIQDIHIDAIHNSLACMPDSTYRDFAEWLLETPIYTDEWLQLVGIHGLIRLTNNLLEGLLTPTEMFEILPFSVPMNISQMYEVVSDNLAIGLADYCPADATHHARRQLLRAFNDAVIARLEWNTQSAKQALLPLLPIMRNVSTCDQSLSPHKHLKLMDAYVDAHPDSSAEDIEYSLYPLLVANLETCSQLVEGITGLRSEPMVRHGLVRRYSGMNALLDKRFISREEMIQIGTDSIMVVPTLAYYVGLIAERIRPMTEYKSIVFDGSLLEALEDAALLVRLLNDMGTPVLEQSQKEREVLVAQLISHYDPTTQHTFQDWLNVVTCEHGIMFSRLRKDCMYGEFNVCLHQARNAASLAHACEIFVEDLLVISNIYEETKARLYERLAEMNGRLGDQLLGKLISRFVEFHKVIYSQPFNEAHGEYAV
jgi:hypothetical protein